jgi:hypothetical protein
MSLRTAALLLGTLAGAMAGRPGLAAQQDTGMMHDSTMSDHGQMMSQDSGMSDHGQMMTHDSAMPDHGQMMNHGAATGPNMMFMGSGQMKAAGDYSVTGPDGKRRLELTDAFSVEAAPDLYLVLATGATPGHDALYVAKLKQTHGAQTYELPKKADDARYTTLLVWSKKEKHAVASAEWHPGAGGSMEHM